MRTPTFACLICTHPLFHSPALHFAAINGHVSTVALLHSMGAGKWLRKKILIVVILS